MNTETNTVHGDATSQPARTGGSGILLQIIRVGLMYLLPLVVVAGGVIGAKRLIETAPKAERRPPEKQATPVHVQPVSRTSVNALIQVMGTVVASQEILLQPRVSGEIVQLRPKFVPGGRFDTGELILQIDPKDYELAVERTKSQVAQAEYELKLEEGSQEIAKREWELLDMQDKASELDQELALRRPHLIKAQAALDAAKAALREAELELERTTIRAPFNCIVQTENIDLGAQVTTQTQLGTLVGTDAYWVQAAVPVDQLQWITFPAAEGADGSAAVIRQELGTGVYGQWRGQVVRLMGGLEPQGRMARVLISVPDPLKLDEANGHHLPLLIDAYVNVAIEGRSVDDIIALPRTALRPGGQIWVMDGDDKLDIRDVEVVLRSRDTVLIRSGIGGGERLVVSDLPAPVPGMALTLREPGTPPDVIPEVEANETKQVRYEVKDSDRAN